MRALVIGADGFAGRWLLRHLAESGDEVAAAVGPRFRPPLAGASRVERIDVRDGEAVARYAAATRPELIYYLAGVSHRGDRDSLSAAAGVTVIGAVNALIASVASPPPASLLFVSSAYVYRPAGEPLREDAPLEPIGLYAISKLAAEAALHGLAIGAGVKLIVARPFNHIGPGQRGSFVVPTAVRQVRDVAAGRASALRVGAIDQVRDFTDVRDVVRAYRLLATSGAAGETYNVASGRGVVIGELIEAILRLAGVHAEVISSPSPEESAQPTLLIGDAAKLRALGWEPRIELETTLRDVLGEPDEEPPA
jgi:GDP-4-dehydro-6-deoxy-D-mannose reductase